MDHLVVLNGQILSLIILILFGCGLLSILNHDKALADPVEFVVQKNHTLKIDLKNKKKDGLEFSYFLHKKVDSFIRIFDLITYWDPFGVSLL